MKQLYTVQRAHKDDSLYGKIHGSIDASKTTCGIEIDEKWMILTNAFNGEITCKDCLKTIENIS